MRILHEKGFNDQGKDFKNSVSVKIWVKEQLGVLIELDEYGVDLLALSCFRAAILIDEYYYYGHGKCHLKEHC